MNVLGCHSKLEMLLQATGPLLEHQNRRGGALSPKKQICAALYWLESGTQYYIVGDMHSIGKATVCRCVKAVVTTVNKKMFNSKKCLMLRKHSSRN